MRGRELLAPARDLAARGTEAYDRSAVGRAYYAAFHTACEYLRHLGFRIPREERAHKYLSFRLQNSGHAQAEEAGRTLDMLRTNRNRADYDLEVNVNPTVPAVCIALAEQVIATLDTLRTSRDIQSIRDAIRAYEHDVLGESTWRA